MEVRVGGVVFEDFPRNVEESYLIGPDGLTGWFDSVDLRGSGTDRSSTHGAFPTPRFRSSRVVALKGWVLARNLHGLESMRARLSGLGGDGELVTLTVQGESGQTSAEVNVVSVSVGAEDGFEAEFQVQFSAPDPRRVGAVSAFPGPSALVFHRGNFPATPVVEVSGSLTAPYSVSSQGRTVTVTQSLTSSQTHRIDMATGWVYRNGVLQPGVTSAGNVFTIPPGPGVLVTGPASMVVRVADTYI